MPKLLQAHLEGDIRSLRSWCGEAVFHKLAADIRARKKVIFLFRVRTRIVMTIT